MSNYRLTSDAQSDLIEIRRFTVKQWGAAQSQKYVSELRQTIHLLASTPLPRKIQAGGWIGCVELSACQSCPILRRA